MSSELSPSPRSSGRTLVALRHVSFEGLGTWEPVFESAGYDVRYVDVPDTVDLAASGALEADLLVVLGGPIGVDQAALYPFLTDEIDLLRERISRDAATIGVCLGAQLIATALGAEVDPGSAPEIGFAPIELTSPHPALQDLRDVPVFSWHADQFALPDGATSLARTALCAHQAFGYGSATLALQFHPELDAAHLERWLVGHAHELSTRGIDPRMLRAEAARHGDVLQTASSRMLRRWLSGTTGTRD
jgi:GMP synthase (glutamine-hydrolysing)